jgi:hypothetical protein
MPSLRPKNRSPIRWAVSTIERKQP